MYGNGFLSISILILNMSLCSYGKDKWKAVWESKIIHFWHIKDICLIKKEHILKMGPIWGWGKLGNSVVYTRDFEILQHQGVVWFLV